MSIGVELLQYDKPHRMWFWMQPVYNDNDSNHFYWKRDCIYIAIMLLGVGGATLMVLSLSMVSILIGEFTVSIHVHASVVH